MKYLIVAWLAVLLVSCGGSPAAEAPPSAPAPTAVPTALPLKDLDLEPLLIQSGDLPVGMSGAQVRDAAPKMFDGMPQAAKTAYQQLANGDKQTGGIAVFLYDAPPDRETAYQFLIKGMGTTQPVDGVGELAAAVVATEPLTFVDLLFRRCSAVAHVRMSGGADLAAATAYAKRLDKRLQAAVC